MLPDFPKAKRQIRALLTSYLRRKERGTGVLSIIRTKRQHEGAVLDNTPFDGPRHEVQYTKLEASFTAKRDELIEVLNSIEYFKQKIDEMAADIIRQKEGLVFSKLNEITKQTGNVVDAHGKPLTPDTLFELLEKIEMDFDDQGRPIMPTLVLHPAMFEKIKDKLPEWEADPGYNRRHKAIIGEKRRQWLDRENRRKLAD